jgi:hypothetical protein
MATSVLLEIQMPEEWEQFRLPKGVQKRLQELLDRQDQGIGLNSAEREEAEGLVDLAEWLSLLRLRARRISVQSNLQV